MNSAATSPSADVVRENDPFFKKQFANPSSRLSEKTTPEHASLPSFSTKETQLRQQSPNDKALNPRTSPAGRSDKHVSSNWYFVPNHSTDVSCPSWSQSRGSTACVGAMKRLVLVASGEVVEALGGFVVPSGALGATLEAVLVEGTSGSLLLLLLLKQICESVRRSTIKSVTKLN